MGAIDRLSLDGGIPPRVEREHVIGDGKTYPEPAGTKVDREDADLATRLETLHDRGPVMRLAVEALVPHAGGVEAFPSRREDAG